MNNQNINNEIKWKILFDVLPVGVSILDSNRAIVDLNQALCDKLKISKEKLLQGEYDNRTYLRSDGSRMPREEFPSIRAVKENKVIKHIEIGVVTGPGETIWTDVSAGPLPGGGAVTVTVDITEHKKTEEKLQEVNSQLTTLLESSTDNIVMLDTQYRFVLFNKAFHDECKEIYGKDLKFGDSMNDMIADHPKDLQNALEYWNRSLVGEDFIITQEFGDLKMARKWYEMHFSPVKNNENNIIGVIQISRDVSKSKIIQDKLIEREKALEKLNSFMLGREHKMTELKNEIEELKKQKIKKD
jgi:PAS domain S-box-containing protein